MWFLGRSGQNELMRTNNFDIKIPGSLHTEVEALAKNYYSFKRILKTFCVVNCYEKTDFWNLWLFWLLSFFGPFLRFHGSKNSRSQKIYLNKKSVLSCLSTTWKIFRNSVALRPYFHNWLSKLWGVISEFWNIFSKKILAQIITNG